MRWALVVVPFVLFGCEGCGGEASPGVAAASAAPASEGTSGATVGGGGTEGEPPAPTEVHVRAEVDRYDRVTIAVENRGSDIARLAPELAISTGSTLPLRVDCEADAPSCVELAPGAVLYPCDCGACDELGADATYTLRGCTR